MSELKPCPFCGISIGAIVVDEFQDGFYARRICTHGTCAATGPNRRIEGAHPTPSEVELINVDWNARSCPQCAAIQAKLSDDEGLCRVIHDGLRKSEKQMSWKGLKRCAARRDCGDAPSRIERIIKAVKAIRAHLEES